MNRKAFLATIAAVFTAPFAVKAQDKPTGILKWHPQVGPPKYIIGCDPYDDVPIKSSAVKRATEIEKNQGFFGLFWKDGDKSKVIFKKMDYPIGDEKPVYNVWEFIPSKGFTLRK